MFLATVLDTGDSYPGSIGTPCLSNAMTPFGVLCLSGSLQRGLPRPEGEEPREHQALPCAPGRLHTPPSSGGWTLTCGLSW